MRKLIVNIAALLLCLVAGAQSNIKVQAPDLVGLNEQFNVTFIISGETAPADFRWDAGSDFQLVWGPQKGSSRSVNIVNGKRTSSSQTTYTYVLMPRNVGKFQLSAAEATVKGEKIYSKAHGIEVVSDGAASQQSSSQNRSSGNSAAQTGTVSADDMYLRMTFSKTRVMLGEPVTATLKLYQRANIAGFEDARFPNFNGFWSQEILAPSNIEFKRESVGDKIYNSAVLRSWSLVPQQVGDLTVDPAELVCLVNIVKPSSGSGSIFDSFFQDDYQTIRKRLSTDPVKIHVSGLPAGAPSSFGGGVGKFNMSASLTKDSLLTHEAASLKVTVTGSGNVSMLDAPKITFPVDFEVYDVKTSDVQGGKVFEYPFIPRSHGDFVLGPVEYAYYDISAGKYVTLKSQPLEIKVGKGNADATMGGGQVYAPGAMRKDVKDVGSDIRFISTKVPGFSRTGYFFAGSPLFWTLTVLLMLMAVVAYFVISKMAQRRADVVGSKNRGASKMARKRLSQAGKFLDGNLYTAFYEELHRALLGFVSDKFNMDATDLSKENIKEKLVSCGISAGLSDEFVSLLDACEFARYSPDSGHDAMKEHYDKAVTVISSIDGGMKKHSKGGAGSALAALILLMLPLGLKAEDQSDADALWNAGVEAYADGRWADAIASWESISEMGLESEELYYNLGDAFFKNDDIAHAVLFYEKCLKLNPANADARHNLEFVNGMVQDDIEVIPEFFLKLVGRKMCWLLSSDAWSALFLVLFAATLALVLLFFLGGSSAVKKTAFICGIVSLVLSLFCISFAFWQRNDYSKNDHAIVTVAVTSVKSSPGSDSAKDLFILHEGTKVKILDEVGRWLNIELADGRQGWLGSADLEVI